jgi:CDP-2,3-bis-(O-geranylgeranyl)-sn-glycerol synthase
MIGAIDILQLVLVAFWFAVPVGVANMAPCVIKGKTPIDMGKKFVDGHRLLGDGKTIEGLIGGTLIGASAGLLQTLFLFMIGRENSMLSFGEGFDAILVISLLSFGALFGDALGSFVKRRLNLDRGAKAPLMDQYNLFVGAVLLLLIFPASRAWFLDRFFFDWHWITLVTVLISTFLLHRGINIIAYALGLKKVPW